MSLNGLTEWEAKEISEDWVKEQAAKQRRAQLRIQALGAAISRRDWYATVLAYEAIRDAFDRSEVCSQNSDLRDAVGSPPVTK